MLAGLVMRRKSLPRWFVAVFPPVGCLSRHLFLCLQTAHAGLTIEIMTFAFRLFPFRCRAQWLLTVSAVLGTLVTVVFFVSFAGFGRSQWPRLS